MTPTTSGNPAFDQLLDDMRAIHARKAHDYANDANRYQNFEYAARVSEMLTDPVDRVFATLIGVKLGRIGELTREGKEAKNEALEDSFLDLATYATLWASYRKHERLPEELKEEVARVASIYRHRTAEDDD